jgi:PAS domain S-box-containing protein
MLYEGDRAALTAYLHVLKDGAGLTRIIVCDLSSEIIVTTDESVPADICEKWKAGNYQYEPVQPRACLTAHQSIEDGTGIIGEVFVCNQLDSKFVNKISAETGLEHTIWIEDIPVTTSFAVDIGWLEDNQRSTVPIEGRQSHYTYSINGARYYAARIPLEGGGLSAEVALDVSDILTTQNQLGFWMVLAIFGVVLLVSMLGILLSRQISRPLVDLAGSAEAFRRGRLNMPVEMDVRVLEVAQVAQALEGARTDLLQTLTSLKSERDWSENLLASIVEGIVTLDREGRITFFSHGAERVTGWSRSEVLGCSCDDVFRLVGSGEFFHQVIPAPGLRAKIDVLLADGRDASLAITRAELVPTEASGAEVALVFRDISEEEAVHRILGHFLVNVAHEFRTPLSALAASIELLLDQAPDLNQAELHELLISLYLGTLGLQTLVDNLLESASIEAGHFRISPRVTDLGNIIAEAVGTMQSLLDKYGQRLVVEIPVDIPTVRADPRRTVQVLVNLIGNASRYGPPDAEILIKVSKTPFETRVAVADQGPGISLDARDNLFRRFVYPSNESNTSQAGAGLGLSVVKAIIEAHGGHVGVDDRPDGGSVFWFTLPNVEGE